MLALCRLRLSVINAKVLCSMFQWDVWECPLDAVAYSLKRHIRNSHKPVQLSFLQSLFVQVMLCFWFVFTTQV